jgi:eukaryotic-like serine/threonine-protein kinase
VTPAEDQRSAHARAGQGPTAGSMLGPARNPSEITSAPLALPAPGDTVLLDSGGTGVVGAMLGQGGQGAVFLLRIAAPAHNSESGGRDDSTDTTLHHELALKWYFPRNATPAQEWSLRELIERGSPDERFLWPQDLARPTPDARTGGFGYVMRLRPEQFCGLVDLVSGRVDVPFRTLATIGMHLAHGFLALHNDGLCYRDISFGNVFFDPATGDVLICDNDNVGIDGASTSTVRGTPYFMAPEVVIGHVLPSKNTDLWSLAVLLFYLLIVHHPLEGRRALEYQWWDEDAMRDLFGTRPVFIFDADDTSNEPVPGYHDNALVLWPLYPTFVRDLFRQSFGRGVNDPIDGRVRESVWRNAMARLRDVVVYCPGCGRQNLYDDLGAATPCWSCAASIPPPLRLRFGRHLVVLNHDTQLYAHHLRRNYDLTTAVAEVARHPTDPTIWGLRNLTDRPWIVTLPGRDPTELAPSRSVTLVVGLEITIDGANVTVEG